MTSLEFDGRARRARAAPAARESTPANQSALAFALGDRGRPLDAATRAPFEVGFGRDLSGVRVHDDARAARAASSLGADAFAVGADVYFGRNRYDAASRDGRRLLAHELGHVVQGTRGERALSTFADEDERVVTSAADRVVTGRRAEPLAPAAAAVLRQEHGAAHERRTPHTLAELERGGDGRIRRPDDGHTYTPTDTDPTTWIRGFLTFFSFDTVVPRPRGEGDEATESTHARFADVEVTLGAVADLAVAQARLDHVALDRPAALDYLTRRYDIQRSSGIASFQLAQVGLTMPTFHFGLDPAAVGTPDPFGVQFVPVAVVFPLHQTDRRGFEISLIPFQAGLFGTWTPDPFSTMRLQSVQAGGQVSYVWPRSAGFQLSTFLGVFGGASWPHGTAIPQLQVATGFSAAWIAPLPHDWQVVFQIQPSVALTRTFFPASAMPDDIRTSLDVGFSFAIFIQSPPVGRRGEPRYRLGR